MALILIANTDFFKKLPGILKICELILIMIVMSLCAHYSTSSGVKNVHVMGQSECFLLIASCTFFLGTFLMITSSILSVDTENNLRRTLFEPLYHFFAFVFIFSGSVAVLSNTIQVGSAGDAFMAAGGIGIIASILYGVSTYDSYMGYITA